MPEDDRQYLVDLGLLRRAESGRLVVASPIYREVLPRALASGPQDSLPQIAPTWLIGISEQDAVRKLTASYDYFQSLIFYFTKQPDTIRPSWAHWTPSSASLWI